MFSRMKDIKRTIKRVMHSFRLKNKQIEIGSSTSKQTSNLVGKCEMRNYLLVWAHLEIGLETEVMIIYKTDFDLTRKRKTV